MITYIYTQTHRLLLVSRTHKHGIPHQIQAAGSVPVNEILHAEYDKQNWKQDPWYT